MKITKVIAHLLEERVKPFTWQVDRPGSGDGISPERMYTCLIRVVTDAGVEGHVVGRRGRVVMDMVERRIASELLGKDPLNTEFLWERIWDIDRLEEFPIYVLGLADIALWDIKGKVAGLPVYKLLGGYRDSIPAQASTTSYDTEKEYLDVIGAALEEGYTAVKLHLRYRDVRTNARLCRTVRQFVGDDFDLALDASALWNYTDSLWFGRVLEELNYTWYEEPMREFDLGSYAKLCDALDIPNTGRRVLRRRSLERRRVHPPGSVRYHAHRDRLQGRLHRRLEGGPPRRVVRDEGRGARRRPAQPAPVPGHPQHHLLRGPGHRRGECARQAQRPHTLL
jgi:L-alanine-DL-glutamate epimerase-like enolase superfamily enzyme